MLLYFNYCESLVKGTALIYFSESLVKVSGFLVLKKLKKIINAYQKSTCNTKQKKIAAVLLEAIIS